MQHTLKNEITCSGVGLHSGKEITMTLKPADIDAGITFIRSDITDSDNIIPGRWDCVVDTQLCTVVGNKEGASVGTVEHVLSALRGCGIDNVTITLDGPEIPAVDGSAKPFVDMIDKAGVQAQQAPRRAIKILKEIQVQDGDKMAKLSPATGCIFGGEIDFNHPHIGRQRYETKLVNGNFRHDIAEARTFGFLQEVEWMRSNGLALGGSLDNAIVLDDGKVMNPGGLRFHNEFIRHKLLDAIGDLYLAGAPILGAYDSHRAGHAMNNKLLRALFADPEAYVIIDMSADLDQGQNGAMIDLSDSEAGTVYA